MDQIKIRLGIESDAAAIAAILESTDWPHPYFDDAASRRKAVREQLAVLLQQSPACLLVAEADDQVVGYLLWHFMPSLFLPAPEAHVSDLFVLASHRGRKIGGSLLGKAMEQARRKGCCRLMLYTRRARQSYQRGFYKKQGWLEREGIANFVYDLSCG